MPVRGRDLSLRIPRPKTNPPYPPLSGGVGGVAPSTEENFTFTPPFKLVCNSAERIHSPLEGSVEKPSGGEEIPIIELFTVGTGPRACPRPPCPCCIWMNTTDGRPRGAAPTVAIRGVCRDFFNSPLKGRLLKNPREENLFVCRGRIYATLIFFCPLQDKGRMYAAPTKPPLLGRAKPAFIRAFSTAPRGGVNPLCWIANKSDKGGRGGRTAPRRGCPLSPGKEDFSTTPHQGAFSGPLRRGVLRPPFCPFIPDSISWGFCIHYLEERIRWRNSTES